MKPHPNFHVRLVRSFYFAFAGIGYLFASERNARIELILGILACAMGWWLGISATQWAVLVLTIVSVLILEGLNTAIESAVDLASPSFDARAKAAKDLAAGMVLLAAGASIVIGAIILGPPLWTRLFGGA